jgi:hypothetical protein
MSLLSATVDVLCVQSILSPNPIEPIDHESHVLNFKRKVPSKKNMKTHPKHPKQLHKTKQNYHQARHTTLVGRGALVPVEEGFSFFKSNRD